MSAIIVVRVTPTIQSGRPQIQNTILSWSLETFIAFFLNVEFLIPGNGLSTSVYYKSTDSSSYLL